MGRAQDLLENLKENVERINNTLTTIDNIKKQTKWSNEDQATMEALYRKEFSLYMDNSSIYDDLMEELENETEFTRKRLADEANKLLKVEIIEI
jgi:hypothetical protein